MTLRVISVFFCSIYPISAIMNLTFSPPVVRVRSLHACDVFAT